MEEGGLELGERRVKGSLSHSGVYAFRKANGGIIPPHDLLAVVDYFRLQSVASGDN